MAQTLPKVANVELNNEVAVEINTTPAAEAATYADMTKAFKTVAVAINETVYNAFYLSDKGFGSSSVTGAAPAITVTGDFMKNDPVCAYLDSIQWEIGEKRVTDVKFTRNGQTVTSNVTLTSIAIAGGDSQAPNAVTIVMTFNGKPVVAEATGETV